MKLKSHDRNGDSRVPSQPVATSEWLKCAIEVHTYYNWPGITGPIIIAIVPIASITFFKNNPPNRTNAAAAHIGRLAQSMRTIGFMRVLIVTPDGELIEGHRSIVSATMAGFTNVAVLVTTQEEATVYAMLNANMKKHTSHDNLGNYLLDEMRVEGKSRSGWMNAECWLAGKNGKATKFARKTLQTMYDHGGDFSTYSIARQLANYCGVDTPAWVAECIPWILRWKQREPLRLGMKNKTLEVAKVNAAILLNKPIDFPADKMCE